MTEEISYQEICASRKQMFDINKKCIFSIQKYSSLQSMIFSFSENY